MSPKKSVPELSSLSLKVVQTGFSVYLESRTRNLDFSGDSRGEADIEKLRELCQHEIDEIFQGPLR